MATVLSQLFVTLGLDSNSFNSGIKAAQKEAKEFEKGLKPLKTALIDIGTPMVAVGGAVTGAFVAMSKQAANYGDAIRDASIRTGVSTEALSGLKFAAEQTGTSFESINTGLIRMSRNALAAGEGTKTAVRAFEALGVSVKDSAGHLRSQDAILLDVANAFSKMEDGTRKAALAQQIFGRGGAQMIEFLNQGEAGIKAFTEQAEKMGLVIGEDSANAADQFNDSLNALQNAQLGLSVTIGNVLLPALTRVVDFVTGVVVEFRKFAAEHPNVIRAVGALAAVLLGSGGLLLGLSAVLAILPSLAAAFTLLTGPIGIAIAAVGLLTAAFVAFPQFRDVVLKVLHDVAQAAAFLGSYLASLGKTILQLATGQFKAAWETFSTSVDRGFRAAADAGNTFDKAVKSVGDALKFTAAPIGNTQKALQGLSDDFVVTEKNAKKTKDEVERLSESFISQTRPADELSGKLKLLLARFSEKDVIKVYGDEIIAAADKQREFGVEVDSSIETLERQARTMKRAAEIIKQNREDILNAIKLPKAPEFLNVAPIVPAIDLSKDLEAIGMISTANRNLTEQILTDQGKIQAARRRDQEEYQQQLRQATEDVKRSAGKIFDDMFIKGQSVFSSLGNLLKGGALSLGRAIFEDIVGALLGPIKLAFDDFFKGILENTIGGFVKSLGSKVGGALSGLTGIGGGAAQTVTGAAGNVAPVGGAGGGVAGATGGAASLTGSFISGGLAFAGGIAGALISKGNAKRTEENTRETRDLLEIMADTWNPLFHAMTIYLEQINDKLSPSVGDIVFTAAEGLRQGFYNALWEVGGAFWGNRPPQIGMGADLAPAGQGLTLNAPMTFSPTINVTVEGSNLTPLQIRDQIIPEIVTVLDSGIRGHREKIAQIVRDSMDGLVGTPAVVGI